MLEGLITALITPFDEHGALDEQGLKELVRFQLAQNVNGLIALGSTGEASTLTSSEKKRVMEICVEEVDNKIPLLFGTGSNCTRTTIENTRLAKEMGASGAMIVSPYYNKPTQEGLYKHFTAVANAVDLPFIIYNVAGRTACSVEAPTLKRLAAHPLIRGVKECSTINQMMDIYRSICLSTPHFHLLAGDDALTLPCLAIGGLGVVSVAANIIPQQMLQLVEAVQKNRPEAQRIHYKFLSFFNALFIESNPIPIKAAMQHMGKPAGKCRLPLCDMEAKNFQQLLAELSAIDNLGY